MICWRDRAERTARGQRGDRGGWQSLKPPAGPARPSALRRPRLKLPPVTGSCRPRSPGRGSRSSPPHPAAALGPALGPASGKGALATSGWRRTLRTGATERGRGEPGGVAGEGSVLSLIPARPFSLPGSGGHRIVQDHCPNPPVGTPRLPWRGSRVGVGATSPPKRDPSPWKGNSPSISARFFHARPGTGAWLQPAAMGTQP